ncbi:hypothetical protein TorRG33x02_344340, partial [Trema orientale]
IWGSEIGSVCREKRQRLGCKCRKSHRLVLGTKEKEEGKPPNGRQPRERQSQARSAFEDKGGDREVLDGGCNKTVPLCQDTLEQGSVGTNISPDKNKHSSIAQASQRATTNQLIKTATTTGRIEVK